MSFVPPKRTISNSAGASPSRVPVRVALSRLLVLLALILFGTGSSTAVGAPQRPHATPTVDRDGSAVERLATAVIVDADGRPAGLPRADVPSESESSDEGDADAGGVASAVETLGIQTSHPLHTEQGPRIASCSGSSCSPRAPPHASLLASHQ